MPVHFSHSFVVVSFSEISVDLIVEDPDLLFRRKNSRRGGPIAEKLVDKLGNGEGPSCLAPQRVANGVIHFLVLSCRHCFGQCPWHYLKRQRINRVKSYLPVHRFCSEHILQSFKDFGPGHQHKFRENPVQLHESAVSCPVEEFRFNSLRSFQVRCFNGGDKGERARKAGKKGLVQQPASGAVRSAYFEALSRPPDWVQLTVVCHIEARHRWHRPCGKRVSWRASATTIHFHFRAEASLQLPSMRVSWVFVGGNSVSGGTTINSSQTRLCFGGSPSSSAGASQYIIGLFGLIIARPSTKVFSDQPGSVVFLVPPNSPGWYK